MTRTATEELNAILHSIAEKEPSIASLFRDVTTTSRTRFPQGFRWHYHDSQKHTRFRQAYFCWSITRNENGKFISWIYDWKYDSIRKREVASFCLLREHVRKKDASARAFHMYQARMLQISNAENKQV